MTAPADEKSTVCSECLHDALIYGKSFHKSDKHIPIEDVMVNTQAENELIAEKLLGWVKVLPSNQSPGSPHVHRAIWREQLTEHTGRGGMETPTFTTWHDCGLILEAFERLNIGRAVSWQLHHCGDGRELHHVSLEWDIGDDASKYAQGEAATTPLAVRAAALSYLRSLDSSS